MYDLDDVLPQHKMLWEKLEKEQDYIGNHIFRLSNIDSQITLYVRYYTEERYFAVTDFEGNEILFFTETLQYNQILKLIKLQKK